MGVTDVQRSKHEICSIPFFSLMSFITNFELSKLFRMATGNFMSDGDHWNSNYLHYTTSQSYSGFMPATNPDAKININARETINNIVLLYFYQYY